MEQNQIGRRNLIAGGLAGIAATAVASPADATSSPATAVASPADAATAGGVAVDGVAQVTEERLRGYTLPLSPRGVANLASAPPWNYAGDVVGVEFWTSAEAAEASLPTGLSPDPSSSGHGYALFIDWQFSGEHEEYLDPVRSLYSEFLVLLDARWRDTPVAWCPYIYVDNDSSLARGWVQGFPKKMGAIHQTRAFPVPGKATPVVGPGGKFGAGLSAAGRQLAEARVTLQQTSTTLPALGRPIVNLRHFPRLTAGQQDDPAVHELTMSILDNPRTAGTWTGSGRLSFLAAPGEELADLEVVRTGVGFRGSLSYTVTDLRILT